MEQKIFYLCVIFGSSNHRLNSVLILVEVIQHYSYYYTLIQPYLTYSSIVRGCANVTTMHKLLILQKRAVHIITRSPYRAASNPLFVRLRLLKVNDICKHSAIS